MIDPTSNEPILTPSGLSLYHRGPSLDGPPRPTFFYYALSGADSLYLDPFNQPATLLEEAPIHVFSSTLPLHGPGQNDKEAMSRWVAAIKSGDDIIGTFIDQARQNLDFVIDQGWSMPDKIAAGGLSRGGYISTLLACEDPRIQTILGFAPLTDFNYLKEFKEIEGLPHLKRWILDPGKLIKKVIRYYIGNYDQRVSTEACFQLVHATAKKAYESGIRVPKIELIVSPSVGYGGHGTLPHTFRDGIEWLERELL